MALKLKRFNTESICDNSSIVIIGKRGTGKTILAKHILTLFPDIPRGIVFSSTGGDTYGFDHQNVEVYEEYNKDALKGFIESQRTRIRSVRRGDSKEDTRAFVLIDDNFYHANRSDKYINDLFVNGHCRKLLVIVILQYPRMTPEARYNTDFVFLFRENVLRSRRMMYESFGGAVEKFETFNAILEHCTDDYGSLVIDNTTRSTQISDIMYWYKVDQGFVEEQELEEANAEMDEHDAASPRTTISHSEGGHKEVEEDDESGCVIC